MKKTGHTFLILLFVLLVACQEAVDTETPSPTKPPIIISTNTPPAPGELPETPVPTVITEAVPLTETATQVPATVPSEPEAEPTVTPTIPPVEEAVTTIQIQPVADGFLKPTFLTHAFDERLFVVEQAGLIWIIDGGITLLEPFLDIRDRVNSVALEQGLLSMAFHPDYQENGRFLVNYTDQGGDTVISEFQVSSDPNRADPDSEQILLEINQPYENHNGGQLQFGPDGYLYIGMGDGGSAGDPKNNGQNPDTLLGSILRVDVSGSRAYEIPADNPFLGDNNARDEIWATGLRNPWRFSFDRDNGDLYIADVGQNIWEEVNFQAAGSPGGQNYGWNIMEASTCFSQGGCDSTGLVLPVAEYNHQEGGCSITGGYIYRGQQFPEMRGNYFFADYCLGNIWGLIRLPNGVWLRTLVLASGKIISSFGEDVVGELYVLDHVNGIVYQIIPEQS